MHFVFFFAVGALSPYRGPVWIAPEIRCLELRSSQAGPVQTILNSAVGVSSPLRERRWTALKMQETASGTSPRETPLANTAHQQGHVTMFLSGFWPK